jgi:phage shock protein A
MSESISSRVARIVAAATHALIEKAETLAPVAVMAQAIREIEQVATEVRVDLGKAEAARHLVLSQIARLQDEHALLAAQIATAIAQGRDDLAAAAIGRQADIEDYLPVLQRSQDEQTQRAKDLECEVLALLAKRKELEQAMAERQRAHEAASCAPAAAPGGNDRLGRVENARSAFERVLSNELGVSGLGAGSTDDAAKLALLVELQRKARIAERLAALKAAQGA